MFRAISSIASKTLVVPATIIGGFTLSYYQTKWRLMREERYRYVNEPCSESCGYTTSLLKYYLLRKGIVTFVGGSSVLCDYNKEIYKYDPDFVENDIDLYVELSDESTNDYLTKQKSIDDYLLYNKIKEVEQNEEKMKTKTDDTYNYTPINGIQKVITKKYMAALKKSMYDECGYISQIIFHKYSYVIFQTIFMKNEKKNGEKIPIYKTFLKNSYLPIVMTLDDNKPKLSFEIGIVFRFPNKLTADLMKHKYILKNNNKTITPAVRKKYKDNGFTFIETVEDYDKIKNLINELDDKHMRLYSKYNLQPHQIYDEMKINFKNTFKKIRNIFVIV